MLGVAASILLGLWLGGQQAKLSGKVIRLHVIANSDSAADQALKLQVRDRILQEAEGLVPAGATVEEAAQAIARQLPELAAAGQAVVDASGKGYTVTASLEPDVWFPTKQYDGFALPGGSYTALRVVIGQGAGKNWWCVVFPPLCLGSVTETVADAASTGLLDGEDIALMTGESEGYVIKFKAIELWEQFKGWAEGR